MLSERSHEQLVVNVVEQTFDVELDDPVVFPASAPHEVYRIQGGAPWPIAKRVAIEDGLEHGLEDQFDHGLSDSVGDCRHAQ